MLLSELKEGKSAIIVKIKGYGAFKKRLGEMGFIQGKEIKTIRYAPLKDPIKYSLMNYEVSLRESEASLIEVVPINANIYKKTKENFNGTFSDKNIQKTVNREKKTIKVALIGNPNSGKTTFYNHASGSSEHVGNYAGVTINVKHATFKHKDYRIEIADLPGTYSLTAYSPEEQYVRDYLIEEKPDIVINLVDASNLERNMFLTTQLIDMDMKVVMALNMYDELKKIKAELDHKGLGNLMGIPIIPTISSKGKGIKELLQKIVDVYKEKDNITRHIHINYGKEVEEAIKDIRETIAKDVDLTSFASPRFLSLKLLEKDTTLQPLFAKSNVKKELQEKANNHLKIIENIYNEDIDTVLTDARYGFVAGALRKCYQEKKIERHKHTKRIDYILTNRIFALPVFLFFMYLTFYCTFTLGDYPMGAIEAGIGVIATWIQDLMPAGMLRDLLVDGIIGGVGNVIIFLPNILILFFFISLMEDTGYMARTVFIMDKFMHKIGLHGRSLIPLIMGFGCNVPAILTTRALKSQKDRIITILINPLMSCSARLPVYLLLIGAFFPKYPSLILFVIYIIGILIAILMARIFRKTLFRIADVPFVMELPPYRIPTIKTLFIHMWNKGVEYLKKVGSIILIASIIIWSLSYFPNTDKYSQDYAEMILTAEKNYQNSLLTANKEQQQELEKSYRQQLKDIKHAQQEESLENKFIGKIGKTIEPILAPLGFDWKISVAIITGAAAKEVVVSTLGVLYSSGEDATEESTLLKNRLKKATYTSGTKAGAKIYTPSVAFSLMLFVLIYFPCIGVIAVTAKEAGWKWALFMATYTTSLAYIVALTFYQMSSLF